MPPRIINTTRRSFVDHPWFPHLTCAIFMAFLAGCCIVQAYYEADAYNRVTGSHVTIWDALMLDLRVIGAPQK